MRIHQVKILHDDEEGNDEQHNREHVDTQELHQHHFPAPEPETRKAVTGGNSDGQSKNGCRHGDEYAVNDISGKVDLREKADIVVDCRMLGNEMELPGVEIGFRSNRREKCPYVW